jgi:hypothetical protein
MTREEINRIKYMVCCPMCDNEKCVKKTDKCEAEIWAKNKTESEDAEVHPINESITKGFEEFTKMMFKQGQAESEDKE